MGQIKTTPQVTQDGQESGRMLLEIIYGGKEAPFGGLDASAPPQYIDPRCFTDCFGFSISNNQIVATGYFPIDITLDQWGVLDPTYLGSGSFYANGKYNNWVLGYTTERVVGPPASNKVTYYIWVWDAGTTGIMPLTAQQTVQQYDQVIPAVAASAQIGVYPPPTMSTGTGNINTIINGITVVTVVNPASSVSAIAADIVGDILSIGPLAAQVTPSSVGGLVNIVANTPGVAGNAFTISVINGHVPGVQQAFVNRTFQGGAEAQTGLQYGTPISPLSWVVIGETLYFGGPGTMIMTYSNADGVTPVLNVLTQYLGANTLAKFGGFLIAGGVNPGPGTTIQNAEMVIAWSAAGQFAIWNPVDTGGLVTGAGFNQETDISDYITGMLITSSMAIVFRTQGLDYLTSLGSGSQPFDFEHLSNSKLGEGCQDSRLLAQYDQMGVYVGNSNIFRYAGGITPIGDKVAPLIIPAATADNAVNRSSIIGPVRIGSDTDVMAFFIFDSTLYMYDFEDKTWMQTQFILPPLNNGLINLAFWSSGTVSGKAQYSDKKLPVLITRLTVIFPVVPTLKFWEYKAGVLNTTFQTPPDPVNAASITFPAEEIEIGRDITIDSVYMLLAGVEGQVVNFQVSGTLDGQVITRTGQLTIGAEGDGDTYFHYKGFFDTLFTGKNPQLNITIPLVIGSAINPFSAAKVVMYGSFEPNQRPTQ